jgi:hypothetical protein
MENRVPRPLFRILPLVPLALVATLVGAAAVGAGQVRAPGACEPQTWLDWHVAVKSQCVTRAYVCHNMTAPRLLRDPRVADAYEDALASNDRARIAEIDVLIGQIRAAYGCGANPGLRPPRRAPDALPHGHPAIRPGPPAADPALGLDRSI